MGNSYSQNVKASLAKGFPLSELNFDLFFFFYFGKLLRGVVSVLKCAHFNKTEDILDGNTKFR